MAENTTAASAEYVHSGVSTIGGKYTEQRKFDKSDMIVKKDARKYPLVTAMMEYGGHGQVTANTFLIFEEEDEQLQFAVTAVSTSVDSKHLNPAVANAHALQFKVGDYVALDGFYNAGSSATSVTTPVGGNASPEMARVTAIGAADDGGSGFTRIHLTRPGYSTEITTDVVLVKCNSAMPDGWTAGSGFNIEPESLTQHVQNLSRAWSLDHNRKFEDAWGEADDKRLIRRKRASFNREMSYLMYFGQKSLSTSTIATQRRNMGGIIEFIPTANFFRLNGPISVRWMNEKSFDWGSRGNDEKMAFVGPQTGIRIDNLEYPGLVHNDKLAEKIGVAMVKTIELSGCTLNIVVDQTFRGTQLVDGMVIVDMEFMRYKTMVGMSPQVWPNIQDPGDHFDKSELYGGVTLWRTFAEAHHIVYDITS